MSQEIRKRLFINSNFLPERAAHTGHPFLTSHCSSAPKAYRSESKPSLSATESTLPIHLPEGLLANREATLLEALLPANTEQLQQVKVIQVVTTLVPSPPHMPITSLALEDTESQIPGQED